MGFRPRALRARVGAPLLDSGDWGFSAFPVNGERQEVTWSGPCRQVSCLMFTFVRLDHVPEVSDLPQGFCTLKTSQSHVWGEVRLFELGILRTRNFEDNFSAKIEVSGWTKTNMAAASHHPRVLSPRYWQTGNVKLLTANRSLSFAVDDQTSILRSLLESLNNYYDDSYETIT